MSTSTSPSDAAPRSGPCSTCSAGSGGTPFRITPIPASASTPVSAKIPAMPTAWYSAGAATSDSANTRPIEAPMIAIVLVRCSSRVRSAASAITAAEIAPAPWMHRPRIVSQMSCAAAARKLPAANTSSPNTITRLRPWRSAAMPYGMWRIACVRP